MQSDKTTEREALDMILALKSEDIETGGLIVGGRNGAYEKWCIEIGIHAALSRAQEVAREARYADSDMKSALEDLVAWEASPGMAIKWKYGDASVPEFSGWADKIWGNARRQLKWD